jgi:plastocyanin
MVAFGRRKGQEFRMMRTRKVVSLLTALGALLFSHGALAANVLVKMSNFAFTPTNAAINAGDSVTWTNTGFTGHNTTSESPAHPNLWASSPSFSTPGTFTFTFTNAGSYPYECTIHVQDGMTGTVTVSAAAASPPTVALTAPASNSVFAVGTPVVLQAAASSSSGTITNVQFFSGANLLGAVAQAPYSFTVSGLAAGAYTFTAKATDNSNNSTVSAPVTVTVAAISLLSPGLSAAGVFQFTIQGSVAGKTNLIQASTSLPTWVTIGTNTTPGSVFTDPAAASFPSRFYRTVELP